MYRDYRLKVERILPENNETNNQIRRLGFIPGVLYGKDVATTRIKVDGKSLQGVLTRNGSNAIFEVMLEGKVRPVIVKEVQREPVTNRILHIDLHNINREEKIKTTLPINVTGNNNVIRRGGVLQHQLKELDIVGLSSHIPPYIKVDVSKLSPGQSLRVQDVEIAEELTVLNKPDDIIATILTDSCPKENPDKNPDNNEESTDQG